MNYILPSTLNLPLFITDVSYAFFFLTTVLFGLWIYLKSSKKRTHVMFLLMSLAVGVFEIAHVFGTNVPDSGASRAIFTLTLSLIFVVCFTIHWIAAAVDREREHMPTIFGAYVAGVALAAFYILYPGYFLLESAPRMYFPNYYAAGEYFWIFLAFFAAGFAAIMRMLFKAYRMSDASHRNKFTYYAAAILIGFPLCGVGFFLAYGIEVDPIFSVPFNFYVIPLAYGILRYDIMDIKAAARKSLLYLLFVVGTALFIFGVTFGSEFLKLAYPAVPAWALPLASALGIVFFAGFLWERIRDLEALKYEFITVVTHKFRTPLTRIKWASETLKKIARHEEDETIAVSEIENANEQLVELTDMLVGLRKASDLTYRYSFEPFDLCAAVEKASRNMKKHIEDKSINFRSICPSKPVYANIDPRRMPFALQIVIENAVTYTPKGGKVGIKISNDDSFGIIQVRDEGIGIAREDLARLFSKFWRSKEAKVTDTEGMGIGLFMAREIIERHGGQVYAESAGVGRGSTFTIRLPLAAKE